MLTLFEMYGTYLVLFYGTLAQVVAPFWCLRGRGGGMLVQGVQLARSVLLASATTSTPGILRGKRGGE